MKTIIIATMFAAACSAQPPAAGTAVDPSTAAAPATETAAPVAAKAAVSARTAPSAVVADTKAAKLTDDTCTDPDLSLVDSTQSFMMCDGTVGTGTYVAPILTNLVANNIKAGVVVNGITGAYAPVQPDLTNLNAGNLKAGVVVAGVTGTYTGAPQPDLSALIPTNLRSGIMINGVVGNYGGSQPDLTLLVPGNIKNGVSINGVIGTYADLSNLNANVLKGGVVVAGITGNIYGCIDNFVVGCITTAQYRSADFSNLAAGNIKAGVTVAGVAGGIAPCTANSQSGCITGSSYLAANFSTIVPGNLKSGAVVAGVTGAYPSSTYPLTGAAGTELDSASFQARIKSSSAFSWFDSTGARFTGAGDANITAANILSGVSVFGTAGSLSVAAPNTWDVRYGVTVGTTTGSLKMDCQNSIGAFVTLTNATLCGFSFTDQTPSTCSSGTAANCMYKDNQTGLQISHYLGLKTFNNAKASCTALNLNGLTGWRLPGQEELLAIAAQGIGPSTNSAMWNGATYTTTWTQTVSTNPSSNIVVDLHFGQTQPFDNTSATVQTICVR